MKTANHLLHEWGRWSRTHSGVSLQFPRRSVLGRVIDEGPAAGQPTNTEIPMPNLVRITEEVLLIMPAANRVALELKFVYRLSDRVACRDMHCGHTAYRALVSAGIAYLEGYLAALGLKIFDSDRAKD